MTLPPLLIVRKGLFTARTGVLSIEYRSFIETSCYPFVKSYYPFYSNSHAIGQQSVALCNYYESNFLLYPWWQQMSNHPVAIDKIVGFCQLPVFGTS